MAGRVLRQLEVLDPRPKFDLPRPGTAVLPVNVEIGFGNCIRLKRSVFTAVRGPFIAFTGINTAINDEMRHVDILRRQFTRHALAKPTQPKFPHRECG